MNVDMDMDVDSDLLLPDTADTHSSDGSHGGTQEEGEGGRSELSSGVVRSDYLFGITQPKQQRQEQQLQQQRLGQLEYADGIGCHTAENLLSCGPEVPGESADEERKRKHKVVVDVKINKGEVDTVTDTHTAYAHAHGVTHLDLDSSFALTPLIGPSPRPVHDLSVSLTSTPTSTLTPGPSSSSPRGVKRRSSAALSRPVPISVTPIVHSPQSPSLFSLSSGRRSALSKRSQSPLHSSNSPFKQLLHNPAPSRLQSPRPGRIPISYPSSRSSPYRVPLPLSSARSTMSTSYTEQPEPEEGGDPKTPTRPSQTRDPSESPRIVSPLGSISTSRRRAPPAWPSSPRRDHNEEHQSHRQIIAKSAGYYTPAHYSTPTALKSAIPHYSPAFSRSGYAYFRPYPMVSPKALHPQSALPSGSFRPRPSGSQSLQPPPSASVPITRGRLSDPAPISLSPGTPNTPGRRVVTVTPTSRGTVQYQNVSQAWVVTELHRSAPNVWFRPESTDCRIIVPIWSVLAKREKARKGSHTQRPQAARCLHPDQVSSPRWPATPLGGLQQPPTATSSQVGEKLNSGISTGQKDTLSSHHIQWNGDGKGGVPDNDQIPVIVFPLHQDYLITQSRLLRLLLGSIPTNADYTISQSAPQPRRLRKHVLEGDPDPTQPLPEGSLKGAKVMSTPKDEIPAVYVPLPDPGAFGVIIHWLYWGDPVAVETALSRGMVNWQGLVHNIDYLDLDDTIKRVVGKWWRKWIKTESSRAEEERNDNEEDGDDDVGDDSAEEDDDVDEQRSSDGDELEKRTTSLSNGDGEDTDMEASSPVDAATKKREVDIPTVRGKKVPAEVKAQRWVGKADELDEALGKLERL